MNIQSKKKSLKNRIDRLDKRKLSVLERYLSFLEGEKALGWEDIGEEERQGIEEGLKHAENGNLIAHKDVMEKYRKWR